MKIKVDIILPVYNGERFLANQIESIVNQTYTNWRLLIRDDGSKDQSREIIELYRKKYPDKIHVIIDELGNLGVTNNVMHIMNSVINPYVMLCDQDDVWFKSKIANLLMFLIKMEQKYINIPLLCYSDAKVTDINNKIIHQSFHKYSKLDSKRKYLINILQANIFQGASCIFNKKLFDILMEIKINKLHKDIYHDWWIATVVSAYGEIFCYHKPLMLYRQHTNNVLGARESKSLCSSFLQKKQMEIYKKRNYLYVNRILCREFMKYYGGKLSIDQKDIIEFSLNNPNNMLIFMKKGYYKFYSIKEIALRFFLTIS